MLKNPMQLISEVLQVDPEFTAAVANEGLIWGTLGTLAGIFIAMYIVS